jgi:hypothetical protein
MHASHSFLAVVAASNARNTNMALPKLAIQMITLSWFYRDS